MNNLSIPFDVITSYLLCIYIYIFNILIYFNRYIYIYMYIIYIYINIYQYGLCIGQYGVVLQMFSSKPSVSSGYTIVWIICFSDLNL